MTNELFDDTRFIFSVPELDNAGISYELVLQSPGTFLLIRALEWHFVIALVFSFSFLFVVVIYMFL